MGRFTLLLFTLALHYSAFGQGSYTLSDLEVLSQEGGHEEFFNHALDVRPSERQEAWKSMVLKMAEGFGRQLLSQSEITLSQYQKTESLFTWPILKSDDVFKSRRQEIGLRYLKTCLKASEPCWKLLKHFWEADQNNPDVAFKLAELTLNYPNPPLNTWSFLEVALKSPLSEFYCKRDFVMKSLWGKLEIDYIRLGTKGDFLKKIDQTVHHDCLVSLNRWSQNKLYRPDKSSDRELAYQILAAQGKTSEELTDFFYTVYLLEKPSKGELFNYAWNRLIELSKSSTRREKVLKRLKKLDPLPDELLSSLDASKRRVILNHFKFHFPEYLSFYADQCLSYYGGKGSFPQGNPTMNCQSLMNLDNAASLIGEDKVQHFQKVRSI